MIILKKILWVLLPLFIIVSVTLFTVFADREIADVELTAAATDVVICFVCLINGFIILRQKTKKETHRNLWVWMFITAAISSFLGFVIHNFPWSSTVVGILWTLLYPALFEATRLIVCLALESRFGGDYLRRWEMKVLFVLELPLGIPAIIRSYSVGDGSLIFYFAFAIIAILFSLWHFGVLLAHGSSEARILVLMLLSVMPVLYFQLFQTGFFHLIWDFNQNAIAHLFLILSLPIALWGAVKSLRSEE